MSSDFIPQERIESKIYFFRGKKVMLDLDLAALYAVKTKVLNQAVKRNILRFPPDFMFQLSHSEFANLKSQIVTSSSGHGGQRHLPYAFTEQGVAMLSSVLHSESAIMVNIQIIRTFTNMRDMLIKNEELRLKIEHLEKQYDEKFVVVFDAIHHLIDETDDEKTEIGFQY